MYSLQDGRLLFLDKDVAHSITMMDIKPGEKFYICKRPANGNHTGHWDVWLAPETEKLQAWFPAKWAFFEFGGSHPGGQGQRDV